MTLSTIIRRAALGMLLLAGAASVVRAQHGGGGPGRPGGGPGGMMGGGGIHGGDMGRNGPSPNMYPPSAGPARNGLQLAPPGRWWDDKKMVRTLNLRSDQQRRMDDIFDANKNGLVSLYSNLRREEEKLSSMSREDLQDEAKVFAGIDRVAQARAEVAKANAHILLQIRKELDAQQLAELERETANVH